jgi:succinate-semialdehyde dehydrogenase/glutarate-semialdehyde dehydrogenase
MTTATETQPRATGAPTYGGTGGLPGVTTGAGRAVESRDPATGEVWKSYLTAGRDEVVTAVRRARTAQAGWAAQPLAVRVQVLRRFHEALFRRRIEVAQAISRENGKPVAEAIGAEIAIALDFAEYYAAKAPGFLCAPWRGAFALSMKRKRVRIAHEPFGVIGVISPWNYPFMLATGGILPALVAGNAVLLKPSEFTPTCGALIGELFAEAGLPADVLTVLQGDGSTGAALCDADVDKIFFTGSVATGRKVAMKCAERLIPCSLELGGSDPAIVLADADVQHAASGIVWGRFSNAGQTCVAPKRVFVEAAVYDEFLAALGDAVRKLKVGASATSENDVGPVIRPAAVETLEAQRDDAVQRGASVLATAPCAAGGVPAGGSFFLPTVLTGVAADSRVLREETFGPLLPVVKVRDADEAIALANATEFGLSASIWTRDSARGAQLAERIDAGTVAINDAIVIAGMADVPHGGVKHSGTGRTHAMAGLEEVTRTKTTVVDQFAAWRQAWWFGYSRDQLAGVDAFVRFAHGKGFGAKLAALPGFMKFVFSPKRPL